MRNYRLMLIFLLTAITFVFSIQSISAVYMGSDYKWSYCQTYNESEIVSSGLIINEEDLDFAKIRLKMANEDCADMGGIWCEYNKSDHEAYERMLKIHKNQIANPLPVSTMINWNFPVELIKKLLGSKIVKLMGNLF